VPFVFFKAAASIYEGVQPLSRPRDVTREAFPPYAKAGRLRPKDWPGYTDG
jgi:hypothetical protein